MNSESKKKAKLNGKWYTRVETEGHIRYLRKDGSVLLMIWKLGGEERWFNRGNRNHRIGAPSIIRPDGSEIWHRNGKCHRDDGPAIIWSDGERSWYKKGKCVTKRYPK